MKKILIIIFLFFQSQLNAEEYVGSIILSDSTIYTFELNLIINKENITGYSITNYGTSSETKSSIEGTFDKTKNKYVIIEKQIIYTKSKESIKNFCHLKIDLSEKGSFKSKRLEGEFIGYFDNKDKWIHACEIIGFGGCHPLTTTRIPKPPKSEVSMANAAAARQTVIGPLHSR